MYEWSVKRGAARAVVFGKHRPRESKSHYDPTLFAANGCPPTLLLDEFERASRSAWTECAVLCAACVLAVSPLLSPVSTPLPLLPALSSPLLSLASLRLWSAAEDSQRGAEAREERRGARLTTPSHRSRTIDHRPATRKRERETRRKRGTRRAARERARAEQRHIALSPALSRLSIRLSLWIRPQASRVRWIAGLLLRMTAAARRGEARLERERAAADDRAASVLAQIDLFQRPYTTTLEKQIQVD